MFTSRRLALLTIYITKQSSIDYILQCFLISFFRSPLFRPVTTKIVLIICIVLYKTVLTACVQLNKLFETHFYKYDFKSPPRGSFLRHIPGISPKSWLISDPLMDVLHTRGKTNLNIFLRSSIVVLNIHESEVFDTVFLFLICNLIIKNSTAFLRSSLLGVKNKSHTVGLK